MGCLAWDNYLSLNKSHLTDDRLAGVVYSAPFFGIPESAGMDPVQKQVIKGLACIADELVITTGMPMHKNSHNMQY